ncbi:VOC family protein [Intrasporangium oryzae]
MANLVVHFEIHASEPQRLIDFYGALLGVDVQAVR